MINNECPHAGERLVPQRVQATEESMPGSMKLRIGAYNSRGLRNSMTEATEIFTNLDILVLSETWMRKNDGDLRDMLDEYVYANETEGLTRGFGGVGLLINPVLPYETIAKLTTTCIQAVVVRVRGVTITGMYISPGATADDEARVLSKIDRLSRGQAIIIGDLNARNRRWDTRTNARGTRLVKWAAKHNWTIRPPSTPTFLTKNNGVSTPDLAIIRGVWAGKATTLPRGAVRGSDHLPIKINITTGVNHKIESDYIPISQRSNPTACQKAQDILKASISNIEADIQRCNSKEELELLYDSVGESVISCWDHTRKIKPDRYKCGWNWSLDQKARLRRKYYRMAKVNNDGGAWQIYLRMDREIKNSVKANKRRFFSQMTRRIIHSKPEESGHWTRRLMRLKSCSEVQNEERDKLEPDQFTKMMSTPAGEGWLVCQETFSVDDQFEIDTKRAIICAPKKKAVGADGLIAEALQCAPEAAAKLLVAFWKKMQ